MCLGVGRRHRPTDSTPIWFIHQRRVAFLALLRTLILAGRRAQELTFCSTVTGCLHAPTHGSRVNTLPGILPYSFTTRSTILRGSRSTHGRRIPHRSTSHLPSMFPGEPCSNVSAPLIYHTNIALLRSRNSTEAWHVSMTTDPLVDSDDEAYADENTRLDYG